MTCLKLADSDIDKAIWEEINLIDEEVSPLKDQNERWIIYTEIGTGDVGLVEEDLLSFYILFIDTNPILYSHFCG